VSTPDPTGAGPGLRILQYVYFGLWSTDTSAAVIGEVLQTAPDATWVRGSRTADPPRPVSHKWAIECRDHELDVGEQIRQVLARVRPIAPLIQQLVGKGDVVSRLSVVRYLDDEDGQPERIDAVEMEDGTPLVKLGGQHHLLGWYLEAADLELLVALNASLDVDEYN
jgi:hypothetical protein